MKYLLNFIFNQIYSFISFSYHSFWTSIFHSRLLRAWLTNTLTHSVHGDDYIVPKFRSFRQTSPSKNPSEKWSTPLCQKRVPIISHMNRNDSIHMTQERKKTFEIMSEKSIAWWVGSNFSALNQSLLIAIGFTQTGGGHDVLNPSDFGVNQDNSYNTASFSHKTNFSIVFILAGNIPGNHEWTCRI